MITTLYTISIYVYAGLMRLAALWHPKARQWVKGRKRVLEQLSTFKKSADPTRKIYWMHCASLGEFEQGRPLLEALKDRYPNSYTVLTFFSPSGYEIRKHYPQADLVCYLPSDTPHNARRFVSVLQPTLTVFVKYEFWRHYLHHLHRAKIPTVLVSAIFRPEQLFFKSYGGWYRKLLHYFDHFFLQDERSAQLLHAIGIRNTTISGDTRVDRVLQLQASAPEFPEIETFCHAAPVWIAGSTWPVDEQLLFPFWSNHLPPEWKVIIAPHEIGETHLRQIEKSAPLPLIRYSALSQQKQGTSQARILLIDNVGMLSALYQYGRIAYIGGGFGKAIHNLLEPIAFRLPVMFGPKHKKFQEALSLKASGGGFAVEQPEDLERIFSALQEETAYRAASNAAYAYLLQSKGSTDKILSYIATFA